MSAYASTGIADPRQIFSSSSLNTMPPTRKNGLLNKVIDRSTEDSMDSTLARVFIFSNTQCFIDKDSAITWVNIEDVFNSKDFAKDL